ncbi:MAG: PAS domain S-box protein [Methylococcales bacterium]|nr:PAS domain S-box protein [Methylococcales bacterium]
MNTQSNKKEDAELLRKEAGQLLDNHRNTIREQAEEMLGKSGTDISRMSATDIEKLLFEFQVHQIELELQNEELKRTHQELGASRDDFARIYDLSPVAYLTLDAEATIQKANRAAAQLLGCTKEKLVNKRLGKFIHPSDQDNYYLFIQNLLTGKGDPILVAKLVIENSITVNWKCPGFTVIGCTRPLCPHYSHSTYVELHGTVNKNSNDDFQLYLAIQDVTEYKCSQETISCLNEKLEGKIVEQTRALVESNRNLTRKIEELEYSKRQVREREAKLNAIFNATIEGIITFDTSGIILSANAAIETIFGYREEELIGCSLNKLIAPSEKKKSGSSDLQNYLQTGVSSVIGLIREVDGLRKDGTVVPLDISLVKFSIEGISYFTSIIRDVSLRKSQEHLEKAHLEELAHVSRACLVGEMGSGIAHEVNQPLTAIANYSQACLHFIETKNTDMEHLGKILSKIYQQALKAGQIIHHVKDFVSARKVLVIETHINTLVENAVSLCISGLKHNNIKLELDLAQNLPAVTIDTVQIEQVLLNLIRNSVDALKDSTQKNREIQISTHMKKAHQIEVKVSDNGSGIDEAQKEKILNPFFTTKPTGMGMGLSISRSIIEAHEGVLSFRSKPGEGTTFYFTLPVKEKANEQQ